MSQASGSAAPSGSGAGPALVLGMDVGGTSSRCLVATLEGERLGVGRAGGGNPTAHGVEPGTGAIAEAIAAALAQATERLGRPAAPLVVGSTIGAAGFGRSTPALSALVRRWRELGLVGEPGLIGDIDIAFAAGTDEPDGTIVISGTGAIAAELVDRTMGRVADGLGWLLGDAGSGFWLGRAAVRHVVGGDGDDAFGRAVAAALPAPVGGDPVFRPDGSVDPEAALAAAYALAPVSLSSLAPVVVDVAGTGDLTATGILEEAADLLVVTLAQVRDPGDPRAAVLGGSLLTHTPLGDLVEARVAARWPGATVRRAADGPGAGAWLAALRWHQGRGTTVPPDLHARLTDPRG